MGCESSKADTGIKSEMPGTLTDQERLRILYERLPRLNTPEDEARRTEIYNSCKPSSAEGLSCTAVGCGTYTALGLWELLPNTEPVMRLAFEKAKLGWEKNGFPEDYLVYEEFRKYLNYIYEFAEFDLFFMSLDLRDKENRFMYKDEFLSSASVFARCGVEVFDMEAEYNKMRETGPGWVSRGTISWWVSENRVDNNFQTILL